MTFFKQRGGRRRYGSQPENQVKNAILQWFSIQHRQKRAFAFNIKSMGVWDAVLGCYRKDRNPFSVLGVSDLCGFWKRKDGSWVTIFIEVKAGKNTPSDEQLVFLDKIRECGAIGIVAWSLKDVLDVLENL